MAEDALADTVNRKTVLKLNAMKQESQDLADSLTRATRQNACWYIMAAILKCAATLDEKLLAVPAPAILAGVVSAVSLPTGARCVS